MEKNWPNSWRRRCGRKRGMIADMDFVCAVSASDVAPRLASRNLVEVVKRCNLIP